MTRPHCEVTMTDQPIVAEPEAGVQQRPTRPPASLEDVLEMVWPETGLQTGCRVSRRPKDNLNEDDVIELEVDFVTLSLTPLEFIQLASFMRMSVDGLLDRHP